MNFKKKFKLFLQKNRLRDFYAFPEQSHFFNSLSLEGIEVYYKSHDKIMHNDSYMFLFSKTIPTWDELYLIKLSFQLDDKEIIIYYEYGIKLHKEKIETSLKLYSIEHEQNYDDIVIFLYRLLPKFFEIYNDEITSLKPTDFINRIHCYFYKLKETITQKKKNDL